ncbi:MAG: TetR/AcrR family transcriptional regulator [Stappiaceae bacterium]
MARPREFDEKAAMKAVEDIFWRDGFEGTSYSDLMSATGLGKGSLYAAYGNKEALYRHALNAYIEREVGGVSHLFSDVSNPRTGKQRVGQLLDLVIAAVSERGDRRGCFLCNAAVDLAPYDESVEKIVLEAMGRMRTDLTSALKDEVGEKQCQSAAELVLSAYMGMRVMVKAGTPVEQLQLTRDAVVKSL